MEALYIIMFVLLIVSFVFDKDKTISSVKRGRDKFMKILPGYLKLLVIISLVLLFSEDLIVEYLGGQNIILGSIMGLIIGSITMMPGFIAYPLAGVLLSRGVSYMVIASFITTLMMVGVVTYPVEKEYMGTRATIYRNVASLIIAALITISMGLFYGEVLF
ncbi:MAG: hypothetical protein ACOCWE_01175 [Bacillota bacterium]